LQDAFQELKHTLCREGFSIDDETYDEDEVSSLPLDEDIHASSPLHIKKRT
jgi:hypothetical protein